MSKIQKAVESPYVPVISKWAELWKRDDYFLAENVSVFEGIHAYLNSALAIGKSHVQAYLNWMESKGVISLDSVTGDFSVVPDNGYSYEDGRMSFEKYAKYRDMWTKFTDWLYHKEQKVKAAQSFDRSSAENLADTLKVQKVEVDEVTAHALDNF